MNSKPSPTASSSEPTPGEQLEAVVTWSRETEVRAYDGEVEHFVSADSAGIGVRIIRDGRQGLAWAGVLDDEALDAASSSRPGTTPAFGTPDEHAGLAEPDGVDAADARPVRRTAADDVAPRRRSALAVELERLTRRRRPPHGRHRVVRLRRRAWSPAPSPRPTGIRVAGRETSAYVGVYAHRRMATTTRTTGFGFSVGRAAEDLDVAVAAAEAVERCVPMLGAAQGAERTTDGRPHAVRHLAVPRPGRRAAVR